jgi:uncharacterized delta-60 repeat protein
MPRNVALRPFAVVACSIAVLCCSAVARAQTVDPGFNPGADQIVWSMAVQPDGRIIVGGGFTHLGGGTGTATVRNHIGRLNADGTVDPTFNPGTNSIVQAVAVQPDGKILIGGNFTSVGGTLGSGTGTPVTRNRIARFNADGTVDPSFDPGADNNVYALVVQADGKILIGGDFTTLGGGGTGTTTRNALGRVSGVDGSVDLGFNPGASKTGGVPIVYTMALQPDGKVVVGGYFTGLGAGIGATTRNYIGRVNADGTLDTLFNPGATFYVNALALQADGKIVAGGDFIGLGGGTGTTSLLHIGRLNTDGSVDTLFNPGTSAEVHTLEVQADGKIVAAGYFTWMGAAGNPVTRSPRMYIGRLDPDGTVDGAFNPGADNIVESVLIQPDGAIVAGGHFGGVGGGNGTGATRLAIARFETTDAAIQRLTLTAGGTVETWARSGAGPEVSRVTFEFSFDGSFYSLLGSGSRVAGGWQLTSVNLPTTRTVFLRARGYYGTGFQNGSGSIVESIVSVGPLPLLALDRPVNGSTVGQYFTVSGWAVDLGAESGTGISAVYVWAFPANGAAAQFVGIASYGAARPDIGGAFGSQFTNSGFSLAVTATLAPGPYQINAYGYSTVTNSFAAVSSASVTVRVNQLMSLDSPAPGSTGRNPMTFSGWAIDRGASSGTGVDQVVVYAYPSGGGAPQLVGTASYGITRGDIGALFGGQFTQSGFSLTATVTPGVYTFVAFAHSMVANVYSAVSAANVTVQPAITAFVDIDTPGQNTVAARPFTLSGWAVDTAAPTGTGIDAVAVWAYPVGGTPMFVGFGTYGASRPDIGALFGNARFTPSGYSLTVGISSLAPGVYDLVVFGHSSVTNGFTAAGIARVTVQ